MASLGEINAKSDNFFFKKGPPEAVKVIELTPKLFPFKI